MSTALILTLAMVLDAVLGEPRWLWSRLPHPAVLMGNVVRHVDKRLNHGNLRRIKGMAAMLTLGVGAVLLGWVLSWFGPLVEMLVVAILLAQKSLVDHVRAVADALRLSLGDARRAVAQIVGRDTAGMDAPAIARGAIESAAENLSDGVIAPAFWFLIGGLPGLLLYKITNTADSMIGYRNERYEEFGWAAARFDDLLNVVPARLTALLIALSHGVWRDLPGIASDARLHRSPNAGWPEAAMARALECRTRRASFVRWQHAGLSLCFEAGQKDIGATCRLMRPALLCGAVGPQPWQQPSSWQLSWAVSVHSLAGQPRSGDIMRILSFVTALGLAPLAAHAGCGGNFNSFVKDMKSEAISRGHAPGTVDQFFASARHDPKVIKADRRQGVFQLNFTEFARRLISANRMKTGQSKANAYAKTFNRIEQDYGVNRGVLLAFWAFETDYGSFQGDFNTLNALVSLSHDCRRPELFRPQVFAALELFERGDFDPARTTGAWAGEIGMVQMLPQDILDNGVDGDGDGAVNLKSSAPDALMSGGKMLSHLGWRAGEPWLQEVTVPRSLDWSQTGLRTTRPAPEWAAMGVKPRHGQIANLPASIILPQGRKGPAFLAYPNFNVYFEWNQSFTYVLTAAYFANRLEGAPVFNAGNPEPGLDGPQMKKLQQKLKNRGYDVGKIDGILGAGTRAAVQAVQKELGLPADAWPTNKLLSQL